MELAEELLSLAPFGRGNPGVALFVADAISAICVRWAKASMRASRCNPAEPALAASPSGSADAYRSPREKPAEATFTLEINEWNGVTEPRLVLRHARPAEQPLEQPVRDLDPSAEGEDLVLFA